jgi:hypothetical protein
LKDKQEKLLDMKLENKISEELYFFKNNKIEEEIFELNNRKTDFKNDDFESKTQILLELVGTLYQSYFE